MADNWYQDSPIVDAPRAPAAPRPVARGSAAAQALGGAAEAPQPVRQPPASAARGIQPPAAAPAASDAWWEAAPVVQAPQAAQAAPQREVGVGEGIARTIGQAAIPVTRAIGLAASSLAGLVGGEAAQDAVFRKTDETVDSMRREYEFRPEEQVGLPTQVAGGILSAPIELVGGFGAQRGIDTAAEVLQRGGTGAEAAKAGGVSGAVNVGLNLLPVKAGGAVGRVVERQVARGIGQKAAPIVAGGITGGAIAGAGDVAGTAAENAALPEGEEFDTMRRESQPGIAAGLGAAFGGAAGRGASRAAARAAPAEAPPRAGVEAPAGSVGAAGADVETARRERAAGLAVPIELSKGEAMGEAGKFEQMQFERETAKQGDVGEPLRQAAAEKNERLIRNFDAYIDETGAEAVMPRDVGESVDRALRKKLEARKADISKAYQVAEEAGDMAEPVRTDALVEYLNKTGPESINAPVLQTVREKLVQLGGAKRDGEGGLTAGEIPINDLEEIRKMINRVADTTPTNMTFGREVKDRIDAMTADAGGDLYREARRLRTDLGREFNNRAVINDLIRNKRGSADRAVALEDVLDRAILRRGVDDVKHLRSVLQTAGPEGAQAWKDLQGQVLSHLKEQATKSVQRDIRGNPVVSAAGLDKAIRALDDGRLELIFGKKGAETLRDLNDVANNVLTSPPGSVNTSNTAATLRSMVVNAIDTMVTFSATGVPAPALMVMKKALQTIRERGVKKRVAQALEQPANLRPAGERLRFGEIDQETGEVSPTAAQETVGARPEGATDARLAEIERLRAATSNPDALDVLDRRQRKVEAEIAAARDEAERRQRAEELDAMARGSSDPEIRKALAARAEKLRGGAIPVGEAREVTVQQAEPAAPIEPTQIPTGEATELTPEQVEPAPRPAEAPRSAAGSDVDTELTMLQPGAPAKGTKKQPMYKLAGDDEGMPEKAIDTGKRSPFNGKPVFSVVDAAGNELLKIHVADTADQALQLARDLPAKRAANANQPQPQPTYDILTPKAAKEPRSAWKMHRGETDRLAGPDEFFYHVTTHSNARAILRDGLVPGNAQMFGGAYAGHSKGRVFLTDRDGVNFWKKKVEAQLHHKFDNPPAVAVVRIPKSKVLGAVADEIGTKDASANAYFVEGKTLFKRGDEGGLPAEPFKQRAELENSLRAKFGHKLIDALQKRNVITMGDAPADVPRDAQGRFTGSTVELFHDRLDADTAPGVLMHEVGMHYGMEKMLGAQRYAELLADVAKMRQRPEVAKAWADVERNYPDLKPGDDDFVSEVAAHLVESAPDKPIVRRIIDAPRAYLYRQFGVNVGKADPGLLRALAVGALRKSAGVEAVSPNPAALATAGEVEEEETATQ